LAKPSIQLPSRPALENQIWPALRHYWHPVAVASDVQDKPVPVTLLGEQLVLFRLEGDVRCFRDLCIHRGTPLSLGWSDGRNVVCAYHGWAYSAEGACVEIPSLPPDRPIPKRARVDTFQAEERHGFVWVCLDEPTSPIPDFPTYGDSAFTAVNYLFGPVHWSCSAARAIENFVDTAHFPWVHEGILGDRQHPETPVVDISRHGEELRFGWNDLPNAIHSVRHRRVYRLFRPFTIYQQKVQEGGERIETLFFTVTPHTTRTCTLYLHMARNFAASADEERKQREFDLIITDQDQVIVENQRPEELPLDLAAELHIKGPDAVAVEYRRFMGELGVWVDGQA
jgi:phenylpropionate dioxygenase-like ring-hydroxylating dioxygenase large terminal subunit